MPMVGGYSPPPPAPPGYAIAVYKPIHKLIFMIKQIIVKVTSNYIVATGWNFRQTIIEVHKEIIISIRF